MLGTAGDVSGCGDGFVSIALYITAGDAGCIAASVLPDGAALWDDDVLGDGVAALCDCVIGAGLSARPRRCSV